MPAPGTPVARRYLRLNKLLPGDVLLSKGRGHESDVIARYTFGPFSHASLYIPGGLLFESIGDGVGYTGLCVSRTCDVPGAGALADVTHYEKLQVRRHPALLARCSTADDRRDLEDQLIAALVRENGKQYPMPTALAKAGRFVPAIMLWPFLRWLALRPEERRKKVTGLFCSQLVAQTLMTVGAHPLRPGLFGKTLQAAEISPNHLQSRRSLLQIVDEAIADEGFPCERPEPDPRLERRRQQEHERTLGEIQQVQRVTLVSMAKDESLQLRLSLDAFDQQYENLRETTNRIREST